MTPLYMYGTCNGCGCEVHSLNLGFISSTITLCATCEDAAVEREAEREAVTADD